MRIHACLGKPRLGPGGPYALKFEGVAEGKASGKFVAPPLIWTLGDGVSVVEIISGASPTAGSVAGELLRVITGATSEIAGDTDAAVGRDFTVEIRLADDGRRVITIVSATGDKTVVGNNLVVNAEPGNGGFDAEGP
jgi:hypothetical protein